MSRKIIIIWAVLIATMAASLAAQGPSVVLVPNQFLRRWDPVTVFFPTAVGPASAGPEDQSEKWVSFNPPHPGAFRWLDARTLQFRPAEPWPSLGRYTWTVQGRTVVLTTLMAAPTSTLPSDKTEGLDPLDEITLVFAEPLDTNALARMVSIELRPLPGLAGNASRWLGGEERIVGKIMPFLDVSGRMIDRGFNPEELVRTQNWLGLLLFVVLCLFVYFDCRRAKPELGEGGELG